jgi:hypothetical protein
VAPWIGFFALKLGMDSRQRCMKSLRHFRESGRKSRTPPNQHIIMTGTHGAPGGRKPHRLAQAPANPVALDGAACLPRHSETDAHGAMISSTTRLQDECAVGRSHAAGRSPKIAPAF